MTIRFWSTLVNGNTYAFNAASDILNFNDASISAGDAGMLTWTGTDVVFSVSGKANAALNKTVHFTIIGGGKALTDANVTYLNGSKVLIGDKSTGVANDDAPNVLTGGVGDDRLQGLGGNDALNGGGGNDVFVLNNGSLAFGNDTVNGGAGLADAIGIGTHISMLNGGTINFTTHMVTSLNGTATFSNIENAFGTNFADTFITFDATRVLTGLGASNLNFDFARSLRGYAGNDRFTGDSRDGYFELVTYSDAPSRVVVNLATGTATDGYDSNPTLANVQPYTDTLSHIDGVQGSAFNDSLFGGGPATTFSGVRFEQLEGMGGNDVIDANGATNVRADYLSSPLGVTANLATGTASDGWGGTDRLIGIAGLRGSNSNDTLIGNANNNNLEGRNGNDFLDGDAGSDSIFYTAATSAVAIDLALGSSSQTGGQGTDTWFNIEEVRGGDFNDTLRGADGVDNTLEGLAGNDLLDGRTGSDLVRYDRSPNAVNVNLTTNSALDGYDSDAGTAGIQSYTDTLMSIESARGSGFNDTLTGNSGNNSLDGGIGADTMAGGLGNDAYVVDSTLDVVTEAFIAGTDLVQSTATAYTLTANVENLTLIGSANINGTGNTGNNVLRGNDASNVLDGGAGNDTLDGRHGIDTASYASATAGVTANLVGYVVQDTIGAGIDTLIDIENVTGSAFNDTLIGNTGNNVLDGGVGTDTASYAMATLGVTVTLGALAAQNNVGAGTDTLISIENLTGSIFNDTLTGDSGNNVLEGGGGNDTLSGAIGTDTASYAGAAAGVTVNLGVLVAQNTAGAGTDTLISIEKLTGSAFNDTLTGDSGNNVLEGGGGNDTLSGAIGTDTASYASAPAGVTVLLGTLLAQNTGGAGSDTLISIENVTGSAFIDALLGNAADNVLEGGGGNDTLNGFAGTDTASYASATLGVTVNLGLLVAQNTIGAGTDTLTSIENLRGSASNDTLLGTAANNVLEGGAGNDTLTGGGGNDTLNGGSGTDSMAGGLGDDTYVVDSTFEVIEGFSSGTDLVQSTVTYTLLLGNNINVENLTLLGAANINGTGNELNNVLTGNSGNNVLIGGGGIDTASYASATAGVTVALGAVAAQPTIGAGMDTVNLIENLTGSSFNDLLFGDGNANLLDGGSGVDTMAGGLGDDIYGVDSTLDVVTEALNSGTDLEQSTATAYTLTANVENLTLIGSANINGTGNTGNNVLTGNSGNNMLDGGTGNDMLTGGGGNDTLNGGADSDTASYASATAGVTVNLGVAVQNNAGAGVGSDTLTSIENAIGSAFTDSLTGDGNANTLDGGIGIDSMAGGLGDDTYVVDSVLDVVTEGLNAGIDLVQSITTAYTLSANVENLTLLGDSSYNSTGTGNTGDNVLTGNSGNNTLNGGAGNDIASYASAAAGVRVNLALVAAQNTLGAGSDTLISIEGLAGSAFGDTLTGNGNANTLNGGAGNDLLDGGIDADTMAGGLGNDTYVVDSTLDVVTEVLNAGTDLVQSTVVAYTLSDNVENLTLLGTGNFNGTGNTGENVLTGNSGNNTLNGGSGADTMVGGAGNDTLIGGAGADAFLFASAMGATNIDTISGYSVVDDTIRLENAIFTNLVTPGALSAASFRAGVGFTTAADANDFIIFNTTNGQLFYDAGGNTGAASVHFATLTGVVGVLAAADFLIV